MENKNTWVVGGIIILVIGAYLIGQSSNSSKQNSNTKSVDLQQTEQQQTPENKQQILANQKQCSKDGSDYNLTFWHSTDNSNTSGVPYQWDAPEFHYNSKLNTCLLYERYIQFDKYNSAQSYQYDEVIDVYSNKTILTGFFTRDVSVTPYKEDVGYFGNYLNGAPNYTSDEFYRQKNILFSQ